MDARGIERPATDKVAPFAEQRDLEQQRRREHRQDRQRPH